MLEATRAAPSVITIIADVSRDADVARLRGADPRAVRPGRRAATTTPASRVARAPAEELRHRGVRPGDRHQPQGRLLRHAIHARRTSRPRDPGAIVNVASVGGIRGVPNQLAYVASKHARRRHDEGRGDRVRRPRRSRQRDRPGRDHDRDDQGMRSSRSAGEDGWEEAGREYVSANPMQRFGQPPRCRPRRVPALRRCLVRQRRRGADRRRPVPGVLRRGRGQDDQSVRSHAVADP